MCETGFGAPDGKGVSAVSLDERLRFERICRESALAPHLSEGIGTLNEKRLHQILKRFYDEDENHHEIGACGYVADIKNGGDIVEIQTGSFYSLRSKIAAYLGGKDGSHVSHIRIVHPVAACKYISWIDTDDGSVKSRRRSPKKGSIYAALPEIYWLRDCLDDERLSFSFPFLEMEEFRLLDGKRSRDRKKGSSRYEMVPTGISGCLSLSSFDDYTVFLAGLGDGKFYASDFARISGLRGKKTYGSLDVLSRVGLVRRGEKEGRKFTYYTTAQKTEN